MRDQVILIDHVQGDSWALVLYACRSVTGHRTLTPAIFVNTDVGIFAACPHLQTWVRNKLVIKFNPPAERRVEMLKNAVGDFIHGIERRAEIIDRTRVGLQAQRSQKVAFTPPDGFSLAPESEPAFEWLCQHEEIAAVALQVMKALCDRHKLGRKLSEEERLALMSQEEREEYLTKKLLDERTTQ